MAKVVIAYELGADISIEKEVLNTIDDMHIVQFPDLTTPEALEVLSEVDGLMVTLQDVTDEMMSRMKRCRIVSRIGTGLDAIDIPAATKYGIWVTNVPDYSIDEVSTHALSLLMYYARSLESLFSMVKDNRWWDAARVKPIERFNQQTVGVIAYGRIGKASASKLRGLGMNVLVYDPYIDQELIRAGGVRPVDLETLMRESDYVTIHAPLNDSSRKMINAQTLALMKPTAFLINTARGGIVDEDALIAAVRSGQIAGAAIDVLAFEPPSPDHPFLNEPKIIVTPHAAWYSEQSKLDVRHSAAEEVVRVLKGEKPRAPANSL